MSGFFAVGILFWALVGVAAAAPQHYMDEAGNELQIVEQDGFAALRLIASTRTLLISGDLGRNGNAFLFMMADTPAAGAAQEPDTGWKVTGTVDLFKTSARVKVERYGPEKAAPGPGAESLIPPARGLYRRVNAAERLRRARLENEGAESILTAARDRVQGVKQPGLQAILERDPASRKEREAIAREVARSVDEHRPPVEVPDYWQTLAELGRMRARFLVAASGIEAPAGRFGEYIDDSGGTVVFSDPGAGETRNLPFEIFVVRGPTAHTGSLAGTARFLDAGLAEFVDGNQEAFEEGKPATVRFRFQGHVLTVEAERTKYYHGARAFFHGTYYRVAE